jgi:hypothetical protein
MTIVPLLLIELPLFIRFPFPVVQLDVDRKGFITTNDIR